LRRRSGATIKSLRKRLDAWAIEELIGHDVNDRKAFAGRSRRRHSPST
jgi:hypothetical protein